MNTAKINGYGAILRFITPALLSIALFILSGIKSDVNALKNHFTNHLSEHKNIELKLENRLTCIETEFKNFKYWIKFTVLNQPLGGNYVPHKRLE